MLSAHTSNSPSKKMITIKGKPTLEELFDWQKNQTEISIVEDYFLFGIKKIKNITGIIEKVDLVSNSDALIWFIDLNQHGISLRNIVSYSYPQKYKIILDETDELTFPDAITLKADDYLVRVNKQNLIDHCQYFESMLKRHTKELKEEVIDLTNTFDEHSLKILLNFLEQNENIIDSLDDALALLIAADAVCSDELIEKALCLIAEEMSYNSFFDLVGAKKNGVHPLISHWIANVNEWINKYEINVNFSLTSIPAVGFNELIPRLPRELLYAENTDECRQNISDALAKLKALTHVDYQFDGIKIISQTKPSRIINILLSRHILSALPLTDSWVRNSKPSYYFTNISALLKINPDQFKLELIEASQLLTQICKTDCIKLNIYPVASAEYYRVLETIGCIEAEYYTHDLDVTDFDIDKLRTLNKQKITIDDIWERYKAADKTKPLFEQIVNPMQKDFASKADKNNNSVSTSLFTLLKANTTQQQTSKNEVNYLGLKRGFLIGKRF